jgi:hypothetical protein
MRGLHQFISITMEIGISQVIHHNQEDVGRSMFLTASVQKKTQYKN